MRMICATLLLYFPTDICGTSRQQGYSSLVQYLASVGIDQRVELHMHPRLQERLLQVRSCRTGPGPRSCPHGPSPSLLMAFFLPTLLTWRPKALSSSLFPQPHSLGHLLFSHGF